MKMRVEKGRKNQYKGSQKFYVWETKYRSKISSDRKQLPETTTEIHRKCQQYIKINTELNFFFDILLTVHLSIILATDQLAWRFATEMLRAFIFTLCMLISQPIFFFQMKPTRCTLLLSIFISSSLHVSGNYVPIIRRTYCIYATLVFFVLYGWLSGLLAGMSLIPISRSDSHTHRTKNTSVAQIR